MVEWLSVELWITMTQVRFSTRAASKKLGNFSFTPHRPSSLSCINEYLPIYSDGLCERIVYRTVIAARLNASQRSWTCLCMHRSARGVIVSALNGHVKQLPFLRREQYGNSMCSITRGTANTSMWEELVIQGFSSDPWWNQSPSPGKVKMKPLWCPTD